MGQQKKELTNLLESQKRQYRQRKEQLKEVGLSDFWLILIFFVMFVVSQYFDGVIDKCGEMQSCSNLLSFDYFSIIWIWELAADTNLILTCCL